MQQYKCLIADDERLARELLEGHISKIPYLELVAVCDNAIEALQVLQTQKNDILLLDIQMPNLSGLELLRMLKNPPATILTTAYSEYALDSYELDVVDYLVKPIEFERFLKAISKAVFFLKKEQTIPHILPLQQAEAVPENDYFFIKADYKIVKVAFDEVLFIEGVQKYIRIHTPTEKHITLLALSKVLEALPPKKFIRIHRSYIVNIDKIDSIEGNMLHLGKQTIPISKGQKDNLMELVRQKGLFS